MGVRKYSVKTGGWKYSSETGGSQPNRKVGISTVYFKNNFSHNIHKFYIRQHSGRLSLWSSETKSHQHLNITACAILNLCPKLINVLIRITIKWIPQIPVGCEHLCPLQCAEMYPKVLARTIAAVLD